MSNQTSHDFTEEVIQLGECQRDIKELMLKKLDELEKLSEKVQKALIRLEDEKMDQRVEIQELNAQITDLKAEIDLLKADNAQLRQLRLEHIQDLDKVVHFLNKRRRLVTYTLDSPLSPTHDHYRCNSPHSSADDQDS